jgi:hypothetical protein
MAKSQRRQTQNSRHMREILERLKEFDVAEIRLLCDRYRQRRGILFSPPSSRRLPGAGRAGD